MSTIGNITRMPPLIVARINDRTGRDAGELRIFISVRVIDDRNLAFPAGMPAVGGFQFSRASH
jgi:hypothetical protein